MIPNKHRLPFIIILGFLLGVSLSLSLRDYPVLRFAVMLCVAALFSFLLEQGEV